MKKIMTFAAAVAALVFTSCSKEGTKGDTFSKAEILCEVTGADGTGAASDDFWNLVSFTVTGTDFKGSPISATITKANPKFCTTCTEKPTDGKDMEAKVKIQTANVAATKECKLDYQIYVHAVIYDANGNVLSDKKVASTSVTGQGTLTAEQTNSTLNSLSARPIITTKFSLGYFEKDGKWTYGFGWSQDSSI